MNATLNSAESMPVGFAALFVALGIAAGFYFLLTAFHPRWRKVLYWGRFGRRPVGPVLSLWSKVTCAAFLFICPLAMLSDSFGLSTRLITGLRLLAGVISALMMAGMLYDFFTSRFRRSA